MTRTSTIPPSGVVLGRVPHVWFSLVIAGAVLAFFPACQSTRTAATQRPESDLERAHAAWQLMQRAKPGTPTARKALRKYEQAVTAVVTSLSEKEGSAAWGKEVRPGGVRPWRITFDAPARHGSAQTLALSDFAHCRLASAVSLRGFDHVVTRGGLGVPVVLAQDNPRRAAQSFYSPRGEFVPATAVLEFPDRAAGHAPEARLRFYNPLKVSAVPVGQHSLPIAENLTAPLQFTLTAATLDEDRPRQSAPSASGEKESQLFFLNRYDSTKVPVVFVHGVNSSPIIWKNTVNAMLADPDLRRRYQPVCFVYPSKLPIPASAARLRELLKRSRDTLDPQHRDASFGRMVLVGHSMGGLLVRMQVIDSGTDFWRSFFTVPPQKIARKIDPKTQRMLEASMFFKREPDVRTVVFVSTPHRGSVVADMGIVRALLHIVLFMPNAAKDRLKALAELPLDYIHPTLRAFYDRGVKGPENASTKHPFFQALARHPVAVPFHSIIATHRALDPRNATDGIVPYSSAHLDGAASETLVPYLHTCLEKPKTVQAVMKILKETK